MLTSLSADLFSTSYLILLLSALCIGMAKAGVHGIGTATIPLLAIYFGGKASAGLALPLLIAADILAVLYYHRHANWSLLWRLFPWAAIGVVIGTAVGNHIDDQFFRRIMGAIIFLSFALMLWMEKTNKENIPANKSFTYSIGVIAGFTTMVGNLAGPVMALYLLSARLPKYAYIGTTAWFFLVINIFKVPFHVEFWETINWHTLLLNVFAIPLVALGAALGIWVVKKIPETIYRWFIISTTVVAALTMVISA